MSLWTVRAILVFSKNVIMENVTKKMILGNMDVWEFCKNVNS